VTQSLRYSLSHPAPLQQVGHWDYESDVIVIGFGAAGACAALEAARGGASVLLVAYGGLNVLVGALVLSGVIHPAGSVERTALRWHVGVWDLWFLVWGILLALATVGYWRTVTGVPRDGAASRVHS